MQKFRNFMRDLSWILKDNLPHNTCQIYVEPHSKSTQVTLEYHISMEGARISLSRSGFSLAKMFSWRHAWHAWRQPLNCPRFVRNWWRVSGTMAKPSLIEHSHGTSGDKRETTKETVSEWQQWQPSMHSSRSALETKNQEKRRAYLGAFSSNVWLSGVVCVFLLWGLTWIWHVLWVYLSFKWKLHNFVLKFKWLMLGWIKSWLSWCLQI